MFFVTALRDETKGSTLGVMGLDVDDSTDVYLMNLVIHLSLVFTGDLISI